jgi:uncharacterized protein
MSSIVHFEVPSEDVEKAQEFYREVFDWKFEKDEYTDYWMIYTKDEQDNDGLAGGLYKKGVDQPIGVMNYIDADDIAGTLKKIEKKGGKVIVPQSPIPKVGYFGIFQDPSGNTFGLFKSDMTVK